ncbi:MAG: hypothetical protein ACKVHU_18840 [Acidimicrobiales bacterium]
MSLSKDGAPQGPPYFRPVESLHGNSRRDANTHRFLKTCIIELIVTEAVTRRGTELRRLAGAGSAVDALN